MVLQVMPAGIPFGASGYTINNAIWLDGSADYLSRTFSTPTNNKKYTMSCWVKYHEASDGEVLALLMTGGGNDYHYICRDTDYKFRILNVVSAVVDWQIDSNAKYRDVAAWGNLVVSIDTTAASGERARAWWNGDEITSFATETEPTASDTGGIINTAAAHYIGHDAKNGTYAKCGLAEYILLDGTAVTDASSFGETDAQGNWVPVDPSGLTFGANGTWLKFDDANDLGKDSSGATTEYDRTPTHSSATAPYNTVSASTETGGSEAWHAFDDVLGWADGWNATATTGWLQYQFDDAKAITSYTITGPTTGDANRAPNTWTLEGSNTGSFSGEETVLDSQSSVSSWGNNETKTYTFSNTTEYAYYRLDVTAINGGTKVGIDQMELREAGNHWHPISIAASQQVEDSPTDSSADNVGNYATLNPLSNLDSSTISNGNLTLVTNSSNYAYVTSTQAMPTNSGIYWFKTTLDSMANGSTNYVGIVTHSASSTTNYLGADADAIGYRADGLTKSNGSNVSTSLTTCTTNDVIYMKVDTDADTVAWYKNNTSTLIVSESIPSGAVGKPLLAAWGDQDNASTAGFTIDFGTGGFSIPDGQYLHTANLPAPTVKDPDDGFALITLESGTTIEASLATARTGWGSYIDVFRREDGTAEDWDVRFSDDSGNSMHFNSNAAAGAEATLASGVNYSAWSWRVGSTYGCYTAEISHTNGSATNQAHSLGSGVKSAIAKRSDSTGDWYVSHPDMASANLRFNVQDTPTTSELVTVDGTNVTLDSTLATGTYRVIVFEQIEGFSSFVGYDHNGSSDGPYVNLGGSASLVLWRNIDATNYNDFFSTFTTYTTNGNGNPTDYRYNWRGTAAGTSGITIGDVTANGYKMRPSAGSAFGSASGDPMLVWAWGLRPFGGSGVAQARAR